MKNAYWLELLIIGPKLKLNRLKSLRKTGKGNNRKRKRGKKRKRIY